MNLYELKNSSIKEKLFFVLIQLILIFISYKILFPEKVIFISEFYFSKILIFSFNVITFTRFLLTLFIFMKRKIAREELASVPMAFTLYYLGFSFFAIYPKEASTMTNFLGAIVFILGAFLNTFSELQRFLWKLFPENEGVLYTDGLFRYSRHPNFLGDVLWVTGYSIVTMNFYSFIIPIFLFLFFYFYNIPLQENYLEDKYEDEFEDYKSKVKKMIPFIL